MLSQLNPDFILGSNGHAGLSNRKTAELLGVSHTTINNVLDSGKLFSLSEAQTIATHGFQGGNLVKLAQNLAKSNQVKQEAREQCLNFLGKSATIGAQVFIDAMAGIEAPKPQQPALTALDRADKAIGVAERYVALFQQMNPYVEQCLKDLIVNTLQPQLPGTSENWMGVVNFAELELGYKVPMKGEYRRSALGLWVTFYYPHLAERKDRRLCNETQQNIWVYPIHQPEVREQLAEAVKMFFNHQAPGTKLRLEGAFKKQA